MVSSFTRTEKIVLSVVAMSCFGLHFFTNLAGAYGFFRDELYYIACTNHMAWGYVDQPPFSLFLLKASRLVFGDSLTGIRMIPTLMHTGTVVVTGLMVKEMGGKMYALLLASVVVLLSPIHIAMTSFYSMNSIDIFLWSLASYLILRLINTQAPMNWMVLACVLGVGLLNKISVLFLGAGIFVGLVITNRQWFATRWPYIVGAIALLIFLPYVWWNAQNDWAHLEFIQQASSTKYSGLNAISFIKSQLFFLNPLATPLWISGLFAFFLFTPLKKYSLIAWIYLTALIILIVNGTSKAEYLAPAYAGLFAAGGIVVEHVFRQRYGWIQQAYAVLLVTTGVLILPLVLPVLSVEKYITYAHALGEKPHSSEGKELSDLPQFYADMFGWEEKARDVAEVYHTLSEDEQKVCAIFSTNYGRCGAIDFFGEQYGLPKSIGNHNNYWIWGPRDYDGEVVIIVGGRLEDHEPDFDSVVLAKVSTCNHCMPYENNVGIFIGRGLVLPLKDVWHHEKHYD